MNKKTLTKSSKIMNKYKFKTIKIQINIIKFI